MKKFLSLVLAVVMVACMAVAVMAEDAATTGPKPGTGPELSRANDKASVVLYSNFYKRPYTIYQAENAEIFDSARVNCDHEGYLGSGCVALTIWEANKDSKAGIKFNVKSDVAGQKEIVIGYDNGHPFSQSLNLTVNGESKGKLYFPTVAEGVWDKYGTTKTTVNLNAGDNVIILQYDATDYPSSFNIDFLGVYKGDSWKNETKGLKLTIGSKSITHVSENGETKAEGDVAPMIRGNLTYIPVRGVFDAAGADIAWDSEARTVTVKTDSSSVVVEIDNKQGRVNGRRVMMAGAPFIENGRTYIPLRFISESLGYKVTWDGATQTIGISLD
ncbi:MAG: stalk domain-containing protein [Bacillota bacterium]|nr:stalk domain-containing protein [Bacillota bacterium]